MNNFLILIFLTLGLAGSEPLTISLQSKQFFTNQEELAPRMMDITVGDPNLKNLRQNIGSQDFTLFASLFTNGITFSLPLSVGGFQYKMTIDTGSSDFIIKGDDMPGVPPKRYTSISKDKTKQFIGFVSAYLTCYQDDLLVQMGGKKIQTPLLVAQSGVNFQHTEGILGLSYPSLAKRKPTFMQTLIKNKLIQNYSYGVNLNIIQQGRSFISFGQPDKRFYVGKLIQYPIVGQGMIMANFSSAQIGSGQVMNVTRLKTYLDTGATTISYSQPYKQIVKNSFRSQSNFCGFYKYSTLPNFQVVVCRIQNFNELPDLIFTIKKRKYTLTKQNYLRSCSKHADDKDSQIEVYYCQTYIKVDINKKDRLSLGSPFFNRYYTFFDLQKHKIGFAKNKQNVTIEYLLKNNLRPYEEKLMNYRHKLVQAPTQFDENQQWQVEDDGKVEGQLVDLAIDQQNNGQSTNPQQQQQPQQQQYQVQQGQAQVITQGQVVQEQTTEQALQQNNKKK